MVVLWALALSGAAVAGNGGFAPVEPASPNAEGIKQSYLWIAIFTGAIFVLVQGVLIWFIVRYRSRNRARTEEGAQVHGNTNLELAWTVAPVLILAAIGSFVFYKLPGIEDVPSASAQGGRVDVRVEGYRYYWNFTYPNGVIAVDNLRAPVGQTVKLNVSAPDFDVIHSLVDPRARRQVRRDPRHDERDVVQRRRPRHLPGPVRRVLRHPARQHAGVGRSDAARGVRRLARAGGQTRRLPERRASARRRSRASAPSVTGSRGEGDVGPRLQRNGLLEDDAAVEQVVREGRGLMPPVGKDWTDRQMDALIDYLQRDILRGG